MYNLNFTKSSGLGKSIICSKIIEHVHKNPDIIAVYYFCNHYQTSQRRANHILREFTTQLLIATPGLAPYILETFANNGQRPTKKTLGIILEKLTTSLTGIRIIVDGLDECPESDQLEVVDDLLKIKGPTPGACKVLLSSRNVRSISKNLQTKPFFRLDDNSDIVKVAIASFVHGRLETLREKFNNDIVDKLERQILDKANGTPF